MHSLCRLIHDGLNAADPTAAGGRAFLLDLGRAFESYLTAAVSRAVESRRGWAAEPQSRFELGRVRGESIVLQPDILVRRRGKPVAVLDAKWKRLAGGPAADDVHQAIAYAAITGANHTALVYPGTQFARRVLSFNGSRVRLSLVRFPVGCPDEEAVRAAARLAFRPRG